MPSFRLPNFTSAPECLPPGRKRQSLDQIFAARWSFATAQAVVPAVRCVRSECFGCGQETFVSLRFPGFSCLRHQVGEIGGEIPKYRGSSGISREEAGRMNIRSMPDRTGQAAAPNG